VLGFSPAKKSTQSCSSGNAPEAKGAAVEVSLAHGWACLLVTEQGPLDGAEIPVVLLGQLHSQWI
jgi:hypothetical protein